MLLFSAYLLFLLLHDGGAGGLQAAALPGADVGGRQVTPLPGAG